MRVLFVSQEMPPETGWGGIGTYVDILSEALTRKGVEVHVLSVVAGQTASTREVNGVTVHRRPLPHVRGAGRLPPESWRRAWLPITIARLVRDPDIKPDVIECPEWMAEGLVVGFDRRFPLVVRLHSTVRQLFPYTGQGRRFLGLDGWLAARLEEMSARRAHVVVSTESNLDELAEELRLDLQALHAIPYPVRLPELVPIPEEQTPRIAFVGRLEPRKAPEVVLRAAPRVIAELPDARFVFVGRDVMAAETMPSSTWLRREAERLGIAHAVDFTGQLEPTGVAEELTRATVCVFPSRWESFGNVVAEASATGRPVVVSPIPPFRTLVQDGVTGHIVPLDDSEAWASAILGLLSDRDKARRMGLAGATRIRGISAPDHVADLALAAYEHAIKLWRRGRRCGQILRKRRRPGR